MENDTVRYAQDQTLSRVLVPNLAEKRPSVLAGDIIYAWFVISFPSPHSLLTPFIPLRFSPLFLLFFDLPSRKDGTADVEYEGYVYRVEQETLLVKFAESFHQRFPAGTLFSIRFGFNRLQLRITHRAVDEADLEVVWPENCPILSLLLLALSPDTSSSSSPSPSLLVLIFVPSSSTLHFILLLISSDNYESLPLVNKDSMQFNDANVGKNAEQATAVAAIVNKSPGEKNVPYLIFGPFGTGKTKTLVEAINQVLLLLLCFLLNPKLRSCLPILHVFPCPFYLDPPNASAQLAQVINRFPTTRMLICAPSNSAVDAIVENLVGRLTPDRMFRLYAENRKLNQVPLSSSFFSPFPPSCCISL